MINSRFTELLGVEHPIALAPMAGVAGGALASAVSEAGGFGILGGGYGDERWLIRELENIDSSNIGIGFITWRLEEQPQLLSIALEFEPRAIFLSFGEIGRFAPTIRASRCLFIAQVQSIEDARIAADCGVDVVVAQGTEAGGHGSQRSTLPLVPAIVDAVDPIPVLAAGGIGDGRGLAAALMLGAAGIVMGTRFYCSIESMAPSGAQARAMAATGDQTTRSSVFDVLRQYQWPAPYNLRTLENRLTTRYADRLADLNTKKIEEIERFEKAVSNGDYDLAAVIVGEAIDFVNDQPSADEIVNRTIGEAIAALRRPSNFSVST